MSAPNTSYDPVEVEALKPEEIDRARDEGGVATTMTLQGTVVKTLVLVGILIAAAAFTWTQTMGVEGGGLKVVDGPLVPGLMIAGALGGFLVALITIFVPRISPFTSPVYAVLQGLFLAGVSAFLEKQYPGIAL